MPITLTKWHTWRFNGHGGWTRWYRLTPKTLQDVQSRPGAYVLGLPAKRPIMRLLATDRHGILDIGESLDLNKRLTDLHRCVSQAGQTGHMAGWRLGSFGLLEKLGASVADLRISWRVVDGKEDAYRVEGEMLRHYYDLFGELPPLNYKFNWATWVDG